MDNRTAFRLDVRALLIGLGVGVGLVLLTVLYFRLTTPSIDGLLPVLGRVLFIYGPAGFITGLQVRRAGNQPAARPGLAPPAIHAFLAGLGLALVHALIFTLDNAGTLTHQFVVEALLATLIATLAGVFAGIYRPNHR